MSFPIYYIITIFIKKMKTIAFIILLCAYFIQAIRVKNKSGKYIIKKKPRIPEFTVWNVPEVPSKEII